MSSNTPILPLSTICQRSFFFSFILISEFGVIQSGSQSPDEDFANTSTLPPHGERESINLAARAREERFIPDAGVSW